MPEAGSRDVSAVLTYRSENENPVFSTGPQKPQAGGSMKDHSSHDAWYQYADLLDRFTKFWEPRSDLHVEALAWDRTVRLALGELRTGRHKEVHRYTWHATQRNVGTMRELAAAINEACDFVEASNPEWAGLE